MLSKAVTCKLSDNVGREDSCLPGVYPVALPRVRMLSLNEIEVHNFSRSPNAPNLLYIMQKV